MGKDNPSSSPEKALGERVLRGVEVGKRLLTRRFGLYFTQKRVIVAQTGVSSLWLSLMVVLFLGGLFILFITVFAFGSSFFVHELLEIFSGELTIFGVILETLTGKLTLVAVALILIIAPRVLILRTMKARFENLSELSPEDILMVDKRNFDIPYQGVERIEIKKAKARGAFSTSSIQIHTNEKKHEFWLVRVVGFTGYEGKREQLKLAEYESFVRSILPNKTFVT